MKRRTITGIGVTCLVLAGAARADTPPSTYPPRSPQAGENEGAGPTNVNELHFRRSELSVGVGVMAYFDGGAPGTSGAWDARYAFNFMRRLGIEGFYTGAAGSNAVAGATLATLAGGDFLVKPLGAERFNPLLLAGAAYGGYSSCCGGSHDNATVAVPLGAGAEYRLSDRLMLDGRLTYNMTFADSMGPTHASLDNWTMIGRVGAMF